ncbi:MAG: NnrU family protein [Pseudolabrys sp.]
MGLLVLIFGLVLLLGSHVFVTFRKLRALAIEELGCGYRIVFSLFALAGLALVAWGYGEYSAHEWVQVWRPPGYMRHITVGLMLFAAIVLAAAVIPSHIKAWLKHPMLNSVKVWGFAHLLVNGDLGSMVLFGSFLAWASYARVAAKWRGDRGFTTPPAGWTNDIVVVAVGVVGYLLLGFYFHPYVIGLPVFGPM